MWIELVNWIWEVCRKNILYIIGDDSQILKQEVNLTIFITKFNYLKILSKQVKLRLDL